MLIALVNKSKFITNLDCRYIAGACNTQLKHHFAGPWGLDPQGLFCEFFEDESKIPSNFLKLYLQDEVDTPGALGYHSETSDGVSYAKVFVKLILDENGNKILKGNGSLSTTISHEVLELVKDPWATTWVDGKEIKEGSCYALEVCDPVQEDEYDVEVSIDGNKELVTLSNFVYPSWFDGDEHTKYDYLNLLKSAFSMNDGGYIIVRDKPGTETSVFAQKITKLSNRANKRLCHKK